MNKMSNSTGSVIFNHCTILKNAVFRVAIGICISLILVGCGSVGMMASKAQTFNGRDFITLQDQRSDILDVVAEVGKSLNYEISGLDREAGTISLSSRVSLFTGVMIGKYNETMLTISSEEDGKKLSINIYLQGNFGTGGQEAAMSLLGNFKSKLLEKIGLPENQFVGGTKQIIEKPKEKINNSYSQEEYNTNAKEQEITSKLEKFESLYKKGLIDEDEYKEKKAALLKEF